MSETSPDTLEFILQSDLITDLIPNIGKNQWQVLYGSAGHPPGYFTVWCALLDKSAVVRAMERNDWDLMIGDGRPGFTLSWEDGKEVTSYSRFLTSGIRPLVLSRSFHGAFPEYMEVDEEFRLYHNLAEDKARGLLLAFDASGREIEVVQIKQNQVKAHLKYLRQFQAGTGMHLAIYIDSVRYSQLPLSKIPNDQHKLEVMEGGICWRRNICESEFQDGFEILSRVLCKVILEPPPQGKAGIWPFKEDKKQVSYIIGVDENGDAVESQSDHDKLNNLFGANPGAPDYLTPVFFRREVLAKYFAEPERYKVSDGLLSCLGLWSCQIDNDLESHVMVFLGDLGRDLPYEEQLHWRQYNVLPAGGVSETNFRRSFLAQFTDPQSPDLTFRNEYVDTTREWKKALGWSLFLPLSRGDTHLLDTIRIPVTDSQAEFDEQIGHLTKLLVDSLNEKELEARAGGALKAGTKGIGKLDLFFESTQFPRRRPIIQYLRDLQTLRSTGTAHRKGSAYDEIIIKLGVDPTRKPDGIRRFLEQASAALRALRMYYCSRRGDDE